MQFGRRLTGGLAGVKRACPLTGSLASKRFCQVGVAGRPNRRSAAFSPVKHNEPAGCSFPATACILASRVQTALRRQNKYQLGWYTLLPPTPQMWYKASSVFCEFPFYLLCLHESNQPRVKLTQSELKQRLYKQTQVALSLGAAKSD